MAAFTFFHEFKRYLGDGTIDLDTHVFKAYLTNATPVVATNTVKADLAEIAAGNGYTAGGFTCTVTWLETGAGTGIWRFGSDSPLWTATGGAIATFRYVVWYDDTPSSPLDPLVGFVDYGSALVVNDGSSFTATVSASGLFTLS